MRPSHATTTLLATALLTAACGLEPAEYRFGTDIRSITFELASPDEGIHPDDSVLANPRNPFRHHAIGDKTKFELFKDGGNAGGFYAWATMLARVSTGEHQYYTALKLGAIADSGEVPGPDQETVEDMAIRAMQSVLDNFPDSVTYDKTGTIPYRLATMAYKAIVSRGGRVQGDWVLVKTAGGDEAVQGGRLTAPDRGAASATDGGS